MLNLQRTMKLIDIWKKKFNAIVHLREQPPSVSGDLKQLFFSSYIKLFLILPPSLHDYFRKVGSVIRSPPDNCDEKRTGGLADGDNSLFQNLLPTSFQDFRLPTSFRNFLLPTFFRRLPHVFEKKK